jgi:transcriptional regulator with XRE-family HTH domain
MVVKKARKKMTKTTKSTKTTKRTVSVFGEFIASIREDKQQSQVEFAKILGMSKQNLCDLERGRRNTSPKMAVAFAKKLKAAPSKFIKMVLQDLVNRDGLRVKVDVRS